MLPVGVLRYSVNVAARTSGWLLLTSSMVTRSFVQSRALCNVKTILGSMEFGRRLNKPDSTQMTEEFLAFELGKPVEIDTAFMYSGGKTEEMMGEMPCLHNSNALIATKANPWDNKSLSPDSVKNQLETSLNRMQVSSVHLFYLHAPDPTTPIVDSLRAVNELYEEGKFQEFGLSNYAAWQVAEIYTICKNNRWILPTVYQGMYNCLTRMVEKELFPCLRYFGMRFYAFNPLCGGILSGKHKFSDDSITSESGRFSGKQAWAQLYRDRFWKQENFESIAKIQAALEENYGKGNVTIAEAAYRWLYHHSMLDGNLGDGVIIGASTIDHFRSNMGYTMKSELDERIVKQMDSCWAGSSDSCPNYFR